MCLAADQPQLCDTVIIDGSKGVIEEDVAHQQTQEKDFSVVVRILVHGAEAFSVQNPNCEALLLDGLTPNIDALGASLGPPTRLEALKIEKKRVQEERFTAAVIPADADEAVRSLESGEVPQSVGDEGEFWV